MAEEHIVLPIAIDIARAVPPILMAREAAHGGGAPGVIAPRAHEGVHLGRRVALRRLQRLVELHLHVGVRRGTKQRPETLEGGKLVALGVDLDESDRRPELGVGRIK